MRILITILLMILSGGAGLLYACLAAISKTYSNDEEYKDD